MKTWTTTLTAAEAVRIGACDGRCLVASQTVCDCVCGGVYHGALAGTVIGEVTHTVRPPASNVPNVRRHKAPSKARHARTLGGVDAAVRMIELRVEGNTYRDIADDLGVARSTVAKRLREFVDEGSIPVGRAA